MNVYVVLIVFSSIAVAMCFFMISYLLFVKKQLNTRTKLLALIVSALAVRIAKSVFFFLIPQLSTFGVALGFLGFSLLGPLLYFYFQGSYHKENQFSFRKIDLVHIIIPVSGFIGIITLGNYLDQFYLACSISLGFYLLLIFRSPSYNDLSPWDLMLYRLMLVLLVAFTFPYFFKYVHSYAIGTAISSAVVYCMFFYFLKYAPRLSTKVNELEVNLQLEQKIINALELDEVYRQSALTLSEFSELVGVPQYIISRVTKKVYKKTFPETVNSLRISDVQEKLKQSDAKGAKIEQLAFDAGFNTLSTFYAVFKKETSMTPREYQRKLIA
ncbi:hypothetical protein BFP97_04700 [Roseivirga sp. 4D4]|uniref:helix-turn-helix domain-containing protein n=1 Tax=Roseivirga sp. 4D4 TaxID=1889784 RepID=UPI000852E159|nr:helix-turn-helix domain-containing protein [Roseivirga sp. 4D4]OEK00850.1 hypothetical protein BFP97_04700 [Roseivirga sp. 4D4]